MTTTADAAAAARASILRHLSRAETPAHLLRLLTGAVRGLRNPVRPIGELPSDALDRMVQASAHLLSASIDYDWRDAWSQMDDINGVVVFLFDAQERHFRTPDMALPLALSDRQWIEENLPLRDRDAAAGPKVRGDTRYAVCAAIEAYVRPSCSPLVEEIMAATLVPGGHNGFHVEERTQNLLLRAYVLEALLVYEMLLTLGMIPFRADTADIWQGVLSAHGQVAQSMADNFVLEGMWKSLSGHSWRYGQKDGPKGPAPVKPEAFKDFQLSVVARYHAHMRSHIARKD